MPKSGIKKDLRRALRRIESKNRGQSRFFRQN
jgi:hypothetical protein